MDSRVGTKSIKKHTGQLTPAQFESAINAGQSFPCVLLIGEEDYLRQKAEQAYLDMLLPSEYRDLDFAQLSGKKLKGKDLRDALARLPIIGPHCVLYLDEPSELEKELTNILKSYLKNPNPLQKVLLVEADKSSKPDSSSRAKLQRRLKEEPLKGLLPLLTYVNYPFLESEARVNWVINYVQQKGKSISDKAALLLVEISADLLYELASKLDNAILYVGDEEVIDVSAIERISGITSEFSVFDLEKAFHAQSLKECLCLSKRLLDGGETVLRLVNHFHQSLTLVWQLKAAFGQERPLRTPQEILGKRYFVRDKDGSFVVRDQFFAAARTMPMAMIERGLLGLLDLEITLKTRMVQEDLLFYQWLYDVLTLGEAKPEPKIALES